MAGAQTRAMTLHLPQTTQTARPAALRTRPATDASGSEWPHGNRMTAALLLAEDQTLAMARQICANSPGGIRISKRALQANMEVASFAAALELENRGQALLTRCDDMTEALEAFKAKRAPNFSGR